MRFARTTLVSLRKVVTFTRLSEPVFNHTHTDMLVRHTVPSRTRSVCVRPAVSVCTVA